MDCEQCESIPEVADNLTPKDIQKQDETEAHRDKNVWKPNVLSTIGKETYHFAGHEINIWESLDSFGSVIWPAALSLCHYLESNPDTVDLNDKAVLEIGAGTGLVSILASLLGAWVTATDLPEVFGNLRSNLSRNTIGRCRYTPQTSELFWGHELNKTFPRSVYRYDYVLAADVVYHHDFLAELLDTMKHFCQPGTTLIWANKVRFQSDVVFTENFKRTFNTKLLEDDGEVKIYSATIKEESGVLIEEGMKVSDEMMDITSSEENHMKCKSNIVESEKLKRKEMKRKAEFQDDTEEDVNKKSFEDEDCESVERGDEHAKGNSDGMKLSENDKPQDHLRSWAPSIYYIPGKEMYNFFGQKITIQQSLDSDGATIWPANTEEDIATGRETEQEDSEERCKRDICEDGTKEEDNKHDKDHKHLESMDQDSEEHSENEDDENESSQSISEEKHEELQECEGTQNEDLEPDKTSRKIWTPTVYYKPGKEIYHFLGHEIRIEESIDSYGGMIWPAALALCRFLDTPAGRQQIDLLDKSTLELGAGTGLLSIVATLLGAKLTATDLPEILGNLTCNLNRNTRFHRRHEPNILALSWEHELEETHPRCEHHYDYILAADVVYHHDFLPELLSTMRHFCQRGTTLIWANKIRYQSDLVFVENFHKIFNSTLLTEKDEVRIYKATARGYNEREDE